MLKLTCFWSEFQLNELWPREKAELHAEGEGHSVAVPSLATSLPTVPLRLDKTASKHLPDEQSCLSANGAPSVWERVLMKNPPTSEEAWCSGTAALPGGQALQRRGWVDPESGESRLQKLDHLCLATTCEVNTNTEAQRANVRGPSEAYGRQHMWLRSRSR